MKDISIPFGGGSRSESKITLVTLGITSAYTMDTSSLYRIALGPYGTSLGISPIFPTIPKCSTIQQRGNERKWHGDAILLLDGTKGASLSDWRGVSYSYQVAQWSCSETTICWSTENEVHDVPPLPIIQIIIWTPLVAGNCAVLDWPYTHAWSYFIGN